MAKVQSRNSPHLATLLAIAVVATLLTATACAPGALFGPVVSSPPVDVRPEESVVHIFYAQPDSPNERRASGTGFVLSEEGLIVTAAHVVEEDGLIDVKFGRLDGTDGVFVPARVITRDRDRDVALIKIDPDDHLQPLRPVRLARQLPNLGHHVAIYGFPESEIVGQQMRRSSGTVSSLRNNPLDRGDKITRMLELEAKIEPGNSGSPVFNEDDDVVGVVSSRWKTTDSYALAAPIEVVEELVERRFERDMRVVAARMKKLPDALLVQVKAAHQLAISMRSVFAPGSEADRRVAQLEYCMGRAMRDGQLSLEALDRDQYANAWRHIQLIQYELVSHQQDLQFLQSAKRALRIQLYAR